MLITLRLQTTNQMRAKMASFAIKDLGRVGLILFSLIFKIGNMKENEFVINNKTLMDCIQNYKCPVLAHISVYIFQQIRDLESVLP